LKRINLYLNDLRNLKPFVLFQNCITSVTVHYVKIKMNNLINNEMTAKDTVFNTNKNSLFACTVKVTDLFTLMKLAVSVNNSY